MKNYNKEQRKAIKNIIKSIVDLYLALDYYDAIDLAFDGVAVDYVSLEICKQINNTNYELRDEISDLIKTYASKLATI